MDLLCRTCLNESNNMKSIFLDDIWNMLQSCSGLKVHELDGFPSHICSDCLNKVYISYEFRQLCAISYNTLINCLETQTKGQQDFEIGNVSMDDAVQANIKLRNGIETYNCTECPNRYTMLTHLREHYKNDHSSESSGTKSMHTNSMKDNYWNGNDLKIACIEEKYKIPEPDIFNKNSKYDCLTVNDIKTERNDEEYVISSGPDIFIINFKNDLDDEQYIAGGSNSNGDELSIYEENLDRTYSRIDDKLLNVVSSDAVDIDEEPVKKSMYYLHKETQYNDAKYDLTFTSFDYLRNNQITNSSNNYIQCDICDKSFSSLEHKRRHLLEHSTLKRYKCDLCDKTFTRKDNLGTHRKNRHGERIPPKTDICIICQKSFSSSRTLEAHMNLKHSPKGKEWICKFCQQSFKSKQSHKVHLDTHLGKNFYNCELCNRRFSRLDQKNNHMKQHLKLRPFKCDICQKGFTRPDNLRRHRITRHERNRTKRFN